eukprot:15442589-Alexandrium_andersonii.AAC.1
MATQEALRDHRGGSPGIHGHLQLLVALELRLELAGVQKRHEHLRLRGLLEEGARLGAGALVPGLVGGRLPAAE